MTTAGASPDCKAMATLQHASSERISRNYVSFVVVLPWKNPVLKPIHRLQVIAELLRVADDLGHMVFQLIVAALRRLVGERGDGHRLSIVAMMRVNERRLAEFGIELPEERTFRPAMASGVIADNLLYVSRAPRRRGMACPRADDLARRTASTSATRQPGFARSSYWRWPRPCRAISAGSGEGRRHGSCLPRPMLSVDLSGAIAGRRLSQEIICGCRPA